jgi:hypothetical protein
MLMEAQFSDTISGSTPAPITDAIATRGGASELLIAERFSDTVFAPIEKAE